MVFKEQGQAMTNILNSLPLGGRHKTVDEDQGFTMKAWGDGSVSKELAS